MYVYMILIYFFYYRVVLRYNVVFCKDKLGYMMIDFGIVFEKLKLCDSDLWEMLKEIRGYFVCFLLYFMCNEEDFRLGFVEIEFYIVF